MVVLSHQASLHALAMILMTAAVVVAAMEDVTKLKGYVRFMLHSLNCNVEI